MQIQGMDQLLIKIQNIRNIESISIDDFLYTTGDLVPLLTVIYDKGKTIMLSSKEKYFDTLVKKVVEIYNDEKDNILEDSITDPFKLRRSISIDEHTKEILNNGSLLELNDIYKFYNNKNSFDNSLLYQKDIFNLLYPIIKYHIEDFFNKTNRKVILSNSFSGYRDNYIIKSNIQGIDKSVLINYYKNNDNNYTFIISGLLENTNPFNVNLQFKKDRIEFTMINNKYSINANYIYLINSDKVKQIIDIQINNIPKIYENKDLNSCKNEYKNITLSKSNYKWFILPWNARYGINKDILNINEEETIIKKSSIYLYVNNGILKKENYSKIYKRTINNKIQDNEIILDDIEKNVNIVCISKEKNIYLIETEFLDTRYPSGYYQEYLENKYFYHICSIDDFRNLKLDDLIYIDNNIVLNNSFYLNKENMLKLIKGDKND